MTSVSPQENATMKSAQVTLFADDADDLKAEVRRSVYADRAPLITLDLGGWPNMLTIHAPTLSALHNMAVSIQDQCVKLAGGELVPANEPAIAVGAAGGS
jgi:hypothetical protein